MASPVKIVPHHVRSFCRCPPSLARSHRSHFSRRRCAKPATLSAGQSISPLQTQTAAGIRVSPRYTLLDSVYDGDDEVSNPGVKEKYWTTDVAGFYSVNDRLLAKRPAHDRG